MFQSFDFVRYRFYQLAPISLPSCWDVDGDIVTSYVSEAYHRKTIIEKKWGQDDTYTVINDSSHSTFNLTSAVSTTFMALKRIDAMAEIPIIGTIFHTPCSDAISKMKWISATILIQV